MTKSLERVDSEVRGKAAGAQTKCKALIPFLEYNWEFQFWSIQITYLILYNAHTCNVTELSKLKKICFSTLQGMREEASFRVFFEKVRATTRKLEIDNAKLPRQRIISWE